MSTTPNCPFCVSQDVRPITPALTRGAAYRCHDCERIFYVVSEGVTPGIRKPWNEPTGSALSNF
jgi:transposase-like protein